MINYLKKEANRTLTENGAVTCFSSGSFCLDLFATAGALRNASDEEIVSRFIRAFAEDKDLAMKILFFARDIRVGLGERRFFKVILNYLAEHESETVLKNISYIAEYGRYDDILALIGTPCETACMNYIREQLSADAKALAEGREVSLLAKWLPSVNTSNGTAVKNARKIAKACGMSEAQYRKTLSALRAKIRIIENNLREKDYSFDYTKQPAIALYKYRMAFLRNDRERYTEFIGRAAVEPGIMHTGTLTPYDIIRPVISFYDGVPVDEEQRAVIDTTWKALEDFTGSENALVVVDGSGSMYCGTAVIPAAVAESLAIYFAEHNKGAFRNHFITFSANPRLIEIKGSDIVDKVRYCMSFNECSNTNIEKVFKLILSTAVKNRVKQSEMPSKIYIISDMEFDYCADGADVTNFENAKAMFEKAGYRLPQIVFWNVDSRNLQQPVTINEKGVALVSGMSPQIFSMLKDGSLDPYKCMMGILMSERYEKIAA